MAFDPNDPKDVELLNSKIAEAVDREVAGLKTKNTELLADLRKAKGNNVDPAELSRLESELADAQSKLKAAEKAAKDAKTAAEAATGQLQQESAFATRLLVDNSLTAELQAAGVTNPVHLKAVTAMIRPNVAIKVNGENRAAVVGEKALSDYVKEWAGTDEGKAFVTAQSNTGGGAGGSGGHGGKPAGNFGGTRQERAAAIAAKFNLPKE